VKLKVYVGFEKGRLRASGLSEISNVSKKRIRTNREPSSRFQGEGLRKE
jgi:hypothetical protein